MFAFYQLMAWVSLVFPKIGEEMIEDAEFGDDTRKLQERVNQVFPQPKDHKP